MRKRGAVPADGPGQQKPRPAEKFVGCLIHARFENSRRPKIASHRFSFAPFEVPDPGSRSSLPRPGVGFGALGAGGEFGLARFDASLDSPSADDSFEVRDSIRRY